MSRRGAIERASGEYAPRATAQGALFPPFAGVALADILANSAAIVIIMIVVTLVARREEEEQKLEQAEDVAVLLSRELATSFVMNALPTSAPARLHDYVTWPPDRNPQHAEMPIIELHAGFLRDYYTGAVYGRDDLLRHGNAFDDYLASLGTEQLLAMRIDVYSIHEFYIAMSILKAHGVQPRHWHFLVPGANKGALEGPVGVLAGRLRRDRPKMQPSDGWAGDGTGTVPSARPGSGALPNDVALAGAIGAPIPIPRMPWASSEVGAVARANRARPWICRPAAGGKRRDNPRRRTRVRRPPDPPSDRVSDRRPLARLSGSERPAPWSGKRGRQWIWTCTPCCAACSRSCGPCRRMRMPTGRRCCLVSTSSAMCSTGRKVLWRRRTSR